jgi:ATP-dependent DNA helicase RecG
MPARDQDLRVPLASLKGIGPRRAADLARAGLVTLDDLLSRFPRRYEDRGQVRPIGSVEPGLPSTLAGRVLRAGVRLAPRARFRFFEAVIGDDSGSMRVAWLNQPYLADVLHVGDRVVLYGRIDEHPTRGRQMTNPDYELLDEDETIGARDSPILPIYEKVGSLSPKRQRKLVREVLDCLPPDLADPLPADLRAACGLPDRRRALADAHFPPPGTRLDLLNAFRAPAQVRLIFEEFFIFQLGLLLRRERAAADRKPRVPVVDDRVREAARAVLPFRLTDGQKTALREIVGDMQRPAPMNRLLQGDVGAGKTIVALLAAVVAMENELQVAFMAPTEILAEQHYLNIRRLLAGSRFEVALLSAAVRAASRREVLDGISTGRIPLVVGTHALVQERVAFGRLGLVIVDEQHRFGVLQRASLRDKGLRADVLVMTATPIPRTLALTAYGDLDVSVIRELPPGRRPVKTTVKPESRRDEVHAFVRRELDAGRQAYVIYPLVEESAKVDLKAATVMADHLAQEVFQAYRVALVHGRLASEAKERVMQAFAAHEIDLLVATTVVEVGIDVPNASVMVIEHAERFGLSQLHQLRGRIGRGAHESFCVLLYQGPLSEPARERLKAIAATGDGFAIAERDLALRGSGDLFGTRQWGAPTLRVGDLKRDHALLEEARRRAEEWLRAGCDRDGLVSRVEATWEARFGLSGVG